MGFVQPFKVEGWGCLGSRLHRAQRFQFGSLWFRRLGVRVFIGAKGR